MKNQKSSEQLNAVESSLQRPFSRLTTKDLAAAFANTEYKRADWLVSAVMFGLKCIAVKQYTDHGDFLSTIAKAIKDKDGKSLVSARGYMGLANKVLMQISNPDSESEIGARVIAYFNQNKIKFGNFDTVLSTEQTIEEILKYLLEGLSLRGLTRELQKVDMALIAAENNQKKLDGELPKRTNPEQSDFFQLLDRDLFSIDDKIKSRELSRLPKAKVLAYADALIERGERLRAAVETASEE